VRFVLDTGTRFPRAEFPSEVVKDKISEHSFHQQFGEDAGTQITRPVRQFGLQKSRTPSDREHDLFNYVMISTFHRLSVILFTVYSYKHAACVFISTFAWKITGFTSMKLLSVGHRRKQYLWVRRHLHASTFTASIHRIKLHRRSKYVYL
jgi:hypothetical protein